MTWEPGGDDRRRQPTSVGSLIDDVLAKVGGGRRPPLMVVREAWDDIAGARWKDVSRPVKVSGETVVVEVRDGGTASMMRFDLERIAQRTRDIAPGAGVRRVALRVASRPWPAAGR